MRPDACQWTAYLIPLMLAGLASIVTAFYIWRRRHLPGAGAATLLLLAAAEWTIAYALELGSTDLAAKLFWDKVQFLGIVVAPAAWLAYTLQYTSRQQWPTGRVLVLLGIVPLITLLLVFTNESHGLVWNRVTLNTDARFVMLEQTYGPWLWVFAVYAYALLLIATILSIRMLVRSLRLYRRQGIALLLAALVPWLASILELSGLNPFSHFQPTSVAFTVAALAVAWSLSRLQQLDIVSVSRDTVLNSMSDGVLVLSMQRCVLDLNPAAEYLIGCVLSDVAGQPIGRVWPEGGSQIESSRDKAGTRLELAVGQEGSLRLYDVRNSRLADWRGNPVGWVIVLRDITEQRQAEKALRQASCLEAVSRLAGGIAHRINNLMTGVLGNAKLLEMDLADDDQVLELLRAVSGSAREASELAQQMLAFARGGKCQRQVMSLNDVVHEVLRAPECFLPSRVHLDFSVDPGLWAIRADPTQMGQVLLSLVRNAVEAIEGEGCITVATHNFPVDEAFCRSHPGLEPGPHVCLSVQDTGHGMGAEVQARIFEPFFSTRFPGRGMGLAAVYGIVKNHSGHVSVHSEEGRGAIFHAYLPAVQEFG